MSSGGTTYGAIRPLLIGPIVLDPPALLAPMAGITDPVFRRLVRRLGAPLAFTEMISDKGLVNRNAESLRLADVRRDEKPVGVQVFGSDPRSMAEAAKVAEGNGASLIDINMGCPVPKVTKSGAGSALMLDADLASRIVEAVRKAVGIPVTAKIRKGWNDSGESLRPFAGAIESAGVSAIIVHGRTRSQGYSGRADWGSIAEVKGAVSVPVIGNGDVKDVAGFFGILDETGCDGAMVGRAALGNPWIFRQIGLALAGERPAAVGVDERIRFAVEHLREAVMEYGEKRAIPRMRKHLAWYARGLPGAARVRNAIVRASTASEMENALAMLCDLEDAHGSPSCPGS